MDLLNLTWHDGKVRTSVAAILSEKAAALRLASSKDQKYPEWILAEDAAKHGLSVEVSEVAKPSKVGKAPKVAKETKTVETVAPEATVEEITENDEEPVFKSLEETEN